MNCQKCGSTTTYRQGIGKSGKPYAGNFCTNPNCKGVQWISTNKQAQNLQPVANLEKLHNRKVDEIKEGQAFNGAVLLVANQLRREPMSDEQIFTKVNYYFQQLKEINNAKPDEQDPTTDFGEGL